VPEEVPVAVGAATPVEEILAPPQIVLEPLSEAGGKPALRFAEDIMGVRRAKTEARPARAKKKKKGAYTREGSEDGVKARKGRRDYEVAEDEEEIV
jgi:hypothetical protein